MSGTVFLGEVVKDEEHEEKESYELKTYTIAELRKFIGSKICECEKEKEDVEKYSDDWDFLNDCENCFLDVASKFELGFDGFSIFNGAYSVSWKDKD